MKLSPLSLRIGQGYDIHRTTNKRPLILGGIEIPDAMGLDGHSDADVLIHAIIDSLIGATGMGDIGTHFCDEDDIYKNIDSTILLDKVREKILEKNFVIVNIDTTVICEKPKLKPFIYNIETNLAKILEIEHDQINVKAKTNEGLDDTGQEKSIIAHSVALLYKVK